MFISKENLLDFLFDLKKYMNADLYGPIKRNNETYFEKVCEKNDITLEYVNTINPPKEIFFPNEDTIYTFRVENEKIKIKENSPNKKLILFGIRPCDVNALLRLDKVFKYYAQFISRRKNSFIIAVECKIAGEHCFCNSFGTYLVKEGYDILLSPFKDGFLVKIGSKKGKNVVKRFKKYFVKKFRFKHSIPKNFKKNFDYEETKKILPKIFNSREWNSLAERCLSCGVCSFVCPSCHCFELIETMEDKNSGIRKIVWSSCLLLDFSRVAGNHFFRETREERIKQFVYHKLLYFYERFGISLCVGCGRCIKQCPAEIDFFKFLNKQVRKWKRV